MREYGIPLIVGFVIAFLGTITIDRCTRLPPEVRQQRCQTECPGADGVVVLPDGCGCIYYPHEEQGS